MGRKITIDRSGNIVQAAPGSLKPTPVGVDTLPEVAKLNGEKTLLAKDLEDARAKLEEAQSMIDTMDEQAKKQLVDLHYYREELAAVQEENKALKAELSKLDDELAKLREDVEKEKVVAKQAQADAKRAEEASKKALEKPEGRFGEDEVETDTLVSPAPKKTAKKRRRKTSKS